MSFFQSMRLEYSNRNTTVNSLCNGAKEYNSSYMSTFGERLKQRLAEVGLTQKELASASGVSQPTISLIISGRNKGSGFAVQLARTLRCSPEWLATGRGRKERSGPELTDHEKDYIAVRRGTLRLSAGITGYVVEYENNDSPPIFFRREWLATRKLKAEKLIALRVHGPSMEPGLYDGDTVVVNTADQIPKDGEVFAVNYEGEAVIKRVRRDGGEWFLSSDNPDKRRYADKKCDDRSLIIGHVVQKSSERI